MVAVPFSFNLNMAMNEKYAHLFMTVIFRLLAMESFFFIQYFFLRNRLRFHKGNHKSDRYGLYLKETQE